MRTTELYDNYLNGELNAAARMDFESRLANDRAFAASFGEHRRMVETLGLKAGREEMRRKLTAIHEKEFGKVPGRTSILKNQRYYVRSSRVIAIAASVALIAVLSTVAVLSTGGYLLKQQGSQITELKREVLGLKYSSEAIVNGLTKSKKVYVPANFEGTAFALNNNGYILTSYHMVKEADSVYIRNNFIEMMKAGVVYSDPALDLAILKADFTTDQARELTKNGPVPFMFNDKVSEIGERVFTVGYPRKDMVYGEGSLSALSGYYNDTSMYQISIPVNPGNSGGPLLDENGSIIGLVRGKITGAEGTGFAIKSGQILASIQKIESDSLKAEILTPASKKNNLKNLKRTEQVKRISPYVFNVLIYNHN